MHRVQSKGPFRSFPSAWPAGSEMQPVQETHFREGPQLRSSLPNKQFTASASMSLMLLRFFSSFLSVSKLPIFRLLQGRQARRTSPWGLGRPPGPALELELPPTPQLRPYTLAPPPPWPPVPVSSVRLRVLSSAQPRGSWQCLGACAAARKLDLGVGAGAGGKRWHGGGAAQYR